MEKSTRRGFLAWLGIGGASAAMPLARGHKVDAPQCACVYEHLVPNAAMLGAGGLIVHLSKSCPIEQHAKMAEGGCGVYACDFEGCDNKRTTGLASRRKTEEERIEWLHSPERKRRVEAKEFEFDD